MTQAQVQTNASEMVVEPENKMKDKLISKETGITIGLVVTLLGGAMFSGVMYQRVNNLEDQIVQLKTSIVNVSSVRDDTIILKEQLRQVGVVVSEVREDVRDLKNRK